MRPDLEVADGGCHINEKYYYLLVKRKSFGQKKSKG
ncbi:hypothetical protein ACVILI_006900 [Mesorhizobium sp. USDA 4775]